MKATKPNYQEKMKNYFKALDLPQEYELKPDEINGKTFSVAIFKDGVLQPISNFYTPKEMSIYLFGVYDAETKKFK